MDKYKWAIAIVLTFVVSFILAIIPWSLIFMSQSILFKMVLIIGLGLGCGWGAHLIMHHYLFSDRQQVIWTSTISTLAVVIISAVHLWYIEMYIVIHRILQEMNMPDPDIVVIDWNIGLVILSLILFLIAFNSFSFRLEDKSIIRIYLWAIPVWVVVFLIQWGVIYLIVDYLLTQGMSEIFTFT